MSTPDCLPDDLSENISLGLFGSEVTRWTQESLLAMQSTLLQNTHFKFLAQTLINLPSLRSSLEECYGPLKFIDHEKLQELNDFAAGKSIPDSKSLSNIHCAALTVIDHLIDFISKAVDENIGLVTGEALRLPTFYAVQGFCIGFLSAAAVSSSRDWTEFERNASNALRLATCIGAVIDVEDQMRSSTARTTALSVRWKTDFDIAYLESCLDIFPDAYVSSITDERALTITIPSREETSFTSRLRKVDIKTSSIGIHGCFHSSKNADAAQALKVLCAANRELQLPDAENLCLPLRSTGDAEIIATGTLHDVAIDVILCKKARWFETIKTTLAETQCRKNVRFLLFGKESFVPRSLSSRQKSLASADEDPYHKEVGDSQSLQLKGVGEVVQAEEIAIVGMACRFPQAETVEDFWQLISSGESALGKIPIDRFDPAGMAREPKLANFWGNFIKDPDQFDHRFFGVSGREAKSMDPQQRLALQVTYEALECSGYCSSPVAKQQTDIGCYLGVGSVDYGDNVASENANSFSATGTLRAFISGRISHFFGWTGPSITFDTACSSSAVAIHSACKALHNNECSMAVAGGVNIITSPILHQNLSTASFLNPHGSSRAFDSSASGYCRGEGAGILALKPLSRAVVDGDSILGIIAGSAVNQSSNCSPITVPDSQSQKMLYQKALASGGIDPKDVTYVEAHGTGTPVGDPVEYESVRLAFAGPWRSSDLFVGSVKDNIGHAESASGAAGVIKTLLMMQHRSIPRQANFATLNPRIKYSASDRITIPTDTQPWTAQKRVALVNNYGAAGSNAAIVLRQHEDASESRQMSADSQLASYPILLSAKTPTSLRFNIVALSSYAPRAESPLSNIAYNIARRRNFSFECRAAFAVTDSTGLLKGLLDSNKDMACMTTSSKSKPIVLCFGGQTGRHVTLSRELYDSCALFRTYLNKCDSECQALGLLRIIPSIFSKDPVEDLVSLHCMLFALQFCSAKCWIDCGLEVDTLVGHSLGQLTALCIADSMSLKDALRLISGRARLIRDLWGQERGIMLSVECDREAIDSVVKDVNSRRGFRVDIACYNGPRSFVLAGDAPSIENLEETCQSPDSTMRFKTIRLQTTHGFHSYLTEGILPGLERVAKAIEIRSPRIQVETCSSNGTWSEVTAEEITKHTRHAVYFSDAVDRIAARLPSAVWLEVGSESPIISMTRRILASHPDSANTLIPMDLGTRDASKNLANATCELWKAGSCAQYWLFHASQKSCYTNLNLPPYQFERTRHWIQYRPQMKSEKDTQNSEAKQPNLVSLVKEVRDEALFSVDTSNSVFDLATKGHAVACQSICPASMYIELAARCAILLLGGMSGKLPQFEGLTMSSPLGLSVDVDLFLRFCKTFEGAWEFTIFSHPQKDNGEIKHANGRINMTPIEDPFLASRMKLIKRLARSSRTNHVIKSPSATGISGSMVYKIFSDVVEYAEYYRGVKKLTGLDNEAVGLVTIPTDPPFTIDPGVCDPISLDNFLQVAGIHINCLSNRNVNEVFMCNAVEEIFFSQSYIKNRAQNRSWTVYTSYEMSSKTHFISDIFVYDSDSKDLVLIIIGAKFRSVPFQTVVNSLASLNKVKTNSYSSDKDQEDSGYQTSPMPLDEEDKRQPDVDTTLNEPLTPLSDGVQSRNRVEFSNSDLLILKVREMFSDIIEIPVDEIGDTSDFVDLGIDSLLVTEVLGEIEKRFNVNITPGEFQEFHNVLSLCRRIQPHSFNKGVQSTAKGCKSKQAESGAKNGAFRKFQDTTGSADRIPSNFAVASKSSFVKIKQNYEQHAENTGFANFCTDVLPLQLKLVIQYVLMAFASLGCELRTMKSGDEVPPIQYIPKHQKLVAQLYKILQVAGIITKEDEIIRRTAMPISDVSASALHSTFLEKFPKHTSETKLLYTTAHVLADCLSGSNDPTALLFRDSTARTLLEDVYTNAPMFKTGTLLLAQYLSDVLESYGGSREIKVLELGAGTGGTTKFLLEKLTSTKHKFTYTFTDLSSSLVAAAKRKFAGYSFMYYDVLDVEKDPEPQFAGSYDVIISTNCIHATRDLVVSANNIRKMLRTDGILCLVELTRNLFWFDLVFGLLEGWWLFTDGREHVLADESRWEHCLCAAGFQWVDWTDGVSEESQILRVITASPCGVMPPVDTNGRDNNVPRDSQQVQETLIFKEVDGLNLKADIYYPPEVIVSSKSLPVALMIHGGGHIMLSRNDIRQEQINLLLHSGFLPVSIDYRLCPEVTLPEGPMADAADALAWIRNVLPKIRLQRRDVRVNGERVISVGWSTGGHLAMSLAWTSLSKGFRPPDAILAFYCPTDYEDPFWTKPNLPAIPKIVANHQSSYPLDDDIWSGLFDRPIAAYNVPFTKHTLGGWLAPSDARSRIALYMNIQGRSLNVLLNGLDKSIRKDPPAPTSQQVAAVSPLARIRSGGYATPTFIVHSRQDDLIPWEQAQRTFEALREGGVEAGLRIVEDAPHLFDIYPGYHANQGAREAVREGYEFLFKQVRLCLAG